MTKLSDTLTNLESLLKELSTFKYMKDDTEVTVTVLKTHEIKAFTFDLIEKYGSRVVTDIYNNYFHGILTAPELSDNIKLKYNQAWGHIINMWLSSYNALWNVDGTETRTITTKYGKITTNKGSNTAHIKQLTEDVSTNERISPVESISSRYSFDSQSFTDDEKTVTSGGNVRNTNLEGNRENKTDIDMSTNDTGADTVTDTFNRGGNIGVTMTQQMISAELDLWSNFNFYDIFMHDIVKEITLPYWEG